MPPTHLVPSPNIPSPTPAPPHMSGLSSAGLIPVGPPPFPFPAPPPLLWALTPREPGIDSPVRLFGGAGGKSGVAARETAAPGRRELAALDMPDRAARLTPLCTVFGRDDCDIAVPGREGCWDMEVPGRVRVPAPGLAAPERSPGVIVRAPGPADQRAEAIESGGDHGRDGEPGGGVSPTTGKE